MKSFIPKQPKQVRERLEARLDERPVRKLEQYCRYLESDRDYILAQALELIFRKDKGFGQWLSRQNSTAEHAVPAPPEPTLSGSLAARRTNG